MSDLLLVDGSHAGWNWKPHQSLPLCPWERNFSV